MHALRVEPTKIDLKPVEIELKPDDVTEPAEIEPDDRAS